MPNSNVLTVLPWSAPLDGGEIRGVGTGHIATRVRSNATHDRPASASTGTPEVGPAF